MPAARARCLQQLTRGALPQVPDTFHPVERAPPDAGATINNCIDLACIAADPPLHDTAAFHCQQALEKLLKGFLTLAGKRGGKTHSLEQLGRLAQASFPDVAGLVAAASGWSDWVRVFRYPEENASPEPGEAENQGCARRDPPARRAAAATAAATLTKDGEMARGKDVPVGALRRLRQGSQN
jgi:hypothetical protein